MERPIHPSEQLAGEIEQELASGSHSTLPSADELSSRRGLPRAVVRGALHLLRAKGVVRISRGRPTVVTPAFAEAHGLGVLESGAAQDKLYGLFVNRIRAGEYRQGERFPKAEYLIRTERVSRSTLSQAMKRLSAEGFTHRLGRTWIVGPRRQPHPSVGSPDDAQVIVMMAPTDIDIHTFFSTEHDQPFQLAFRTELARAGFMLSIAHQYGTGEQTPGVIVGIDSIQEHIRSLGDRYGGTFAVDAGDDPEYTRECLLRLCTHRKPVMFFDPSNNRQMWRRSSFDGAKNFFRFHFDEEAAVTVAVEALRDSGHRIVAFPNVMHRYYIWVKERIELFRAVASRIAPNMRVVDADMNEPFWLMGDSQRLFVLESFSDVVRSALNLEANGQDDPRGSLGAALLRKTPSLVSLLRTGATAFVAANDLTAHQIRYWLTLVGIDVPRQLSLVSFDNSAFLEPYRVTTVDFGFSQLGYRAAHVFIGDVPVGVDAQGWMGGVCSLVNRGSIVRPDAARPPEWMRPSSGGESMPPVARPGH